MNGFDIVESKRGQIQQDNAVSADIVNSNEIGKDKMLGAIADNFDTILNLVNDVVSIEKIKVQSDITIKHLREARKQLIVETKCYIDKKNSDTMSIVARMEVIRSMMNDFYQHSTGNLTSEDFCKIISEVVNQMGKIEGNE